MSPTLHPGLVRLILTSALRVWSDVTPLRFHPSPYDPSPQIDIKVTFASGYHEDGYPFDGKGGTLAHAFFPGKGDLAGDTHFDDGESWSYGGKLKLQSLSFASLSPSLFENLELQLLAELTSLRGVVRRHGSSTDESNVLRCMCGSQSPHRCGYLLYFAITDSSLCLGIYDPNKNFHRILPSD